MICNRAEEAREQLSNALARMLEALRILDELDAPGDIGSHVDLAIARLERLVVRPSTSDTGGPPGTPWGVISA